MLAWCPGARSCGEGGDEVWEAWGRGGQMAAEGVKGPGRVVLGGWSSVWERHSMGWGGWG